jgi:hypothetical protein
MPAAMENTHGSIPRFVISASPKLIYERHTRIHVARSRPPEHLIYLSP